MRRGKKPSQRFYLVAAVLLRNESENANAVGARVDLGLVILSGANAVGSELVELLARLGVESVFCLRVAPKAGEQRVDRIVLPCPGACRICCGNLHRGGDS